MVSVAAICNSLPTFPRSPVTARVHCNYCLLVSRWYCLLPVFVVPHLLQTYVYVMRRWCSGSYSVLIFSRLIEGFDQTICDARSAYNFNREWRGGSVFFFCYEGKGIVHFTWVFCKSAVRGMRRNTCGM